MQTMKLTSLAYHRNGVGGEGFHAIAFTYRENGRTHRMVATVFSYDGDKYYGKVHPCTGRVAVLDADLAASGKVGRDDNNTWRGDNFEPQLRQWIAAHQFADMTNREGLARIAMADMTESDAA
jgi:hypothetical protein